MQDDVDVSSMHVIYVHTSHGSGHRYGETVNLDLRILISAGVVSGAG